MEKPFTKNRADGVSQSIGPEFKIQYYKKKKKSQFEWRTRHSNVSCCQDFGLGLQRRSFQAGLKSLNFCLLNMPIILALRRQKTLVTQQDSVSKNSV
jgi:hypothetical protein